MITITSQYPPALARFGTGRTYVMPTWTPVPDSTTLADIHWIKQTLIPEQKITKIVYGSRGGKYKLERLGTRWTCTCTGYAFRKTCKHIKENT